jgi:hypothetical protein
VILVQRRLQFLAEKLFEEFDRDVLVFESANFSEELSLRKHRAGEPVVRQSGPRGSG